MYASLASRVSSLSRGANRWWLGVGRQAPPTSLLHSTASRLTASNGERAAEVIGSDFVVRSPLPDIKLPTQDIYTMITENFPKHGTKIALIDGTSGREYSYNELNESICKFSSGLRRLGFARGNVLGIVAPNCPEYAVVYLGTLATGGVVTTCNPTYTADELAYQFRNSNTKIVATVSAILPTIQEAASKVGIDKIIVLDAPASSIRGDGSGQLVSYGALVADSGSLFDPVRTDPDDVMVLPYSSGTTGFPKGVMLTNSSVAANILQMIHKELFVLDEDNARLVGVLPFFHIYGMAVVLLSSLYAGTQIVTLPKFEPESFLSTIEKHRINIAHVVPPLVVFLAKHPLVEKYDITSIQDLMTGAAPLGGDIVKATSARTKCKLIRQGYGLTETSPVTHMMPRSLGMEAPSSVGHCIRNVRVKVVDAESGRGLGPQEEGELWIQGPNVMKGYLNNTEATENCLTQDGWFKSGDLGYYDEKGLFYITDRLKELIKVKGLQVAPAELEALLLTHPHITDAAVIGVPNERLGEAPRAFVVKKGDAELAESDVQEFVAAKVAKHKHLAGGVSFIDTVPKSASGKILRRVLRDQK